MTRLVTRSRILRRPVSQIALLAVLVLAAGCRTYGGHGSEAATYSQMERIIDRLEQDLSRARGDLNTIESASTDNPYLSVLAAQYARLIEAHEAVLDQQRDLAADLSPDSDYRSLRRAYGSMVTEQNLVRLQYQGVLRNIYDAFSTDTTVATHRDVPYSVVPPYYARAAAADLTVNEVVARVTSGGPPREGFRLLMPEMPVGGADAQDESDVHGAGDAHGSDAHGESAPQDANDAHDVGDALREGGAQAGYDAQGAASERR